MFKKHWLITSTLILIILVLTISNIMLFQKYKDTDKEQLQLIKFCPQEIDSEYNENTKYYTELNYKTFKKLMKKNNVITIGIVDKNTTTSDKFRHLLNKYTYDNNTNSYMLDISKLSQKNLIAFYELDERLPELESNYIITIKKNKILSITTIENEEINTILESLGE